MQYSGHCIYIANSVYVGHSNQYVVIQNDDYAKIYNQTGDYTGHSIYVGRYAYVYGVTLNSILIEKDNYLKEYDFSGRYTGRSIYNPQKR